MPSLVRVVRAYRAGRWDEFSAEDASEKSAPRRQMLLSPTLRRSVLGILHSASRLYGWCRTRWSCATVALALFVRRRISVSGETVRRWLHGMRNHTRKRIWSLVQDVKQPLQVNGPWQ